MGSYIRRLAVSVVLGLVALSAVASATTQTQGTLSPLADKVRHELVTLPYYSVFDNLSFHVDGSKVTLLGQVHRPNLKNAAERVAAGVEGVTSVENQIEVLPNSFFDNRIRLAVAQAIFSHPVLDRYVLRAVSPIHIIVKNGTVTLEGVVAREMEKEVATLRANGVAGVFSVTNNLHVENLYKKKKS